MVQNRAEEEGDVDASSQVRTRPPEGSISPSLSLSDGQLRMRPSLLLLLASAAIAHAELILIDGKLSLLDSVGITSKSSQYALLSSSHPHLTNQPYPSRFTSVSPSPLLPTTLSSGDTLKLSFSVLDGPEGAAIQPHQAMISWEPVDAEEKLDRGRDHMSVVKVRKGGKGKWELVSRKCESEMVV
jgi:hypothetical protein